MSIASREDLAGIAQASGIGQIAPEWAGANLVASGIPDFTTIPPAARLILEGGAGTAIDVETGPCCYPGEVIERHHPDHDLGFAAAAAGRRGFTGWIEKPGCIAVGEPARLHAPPHRAHARL